MKTKLITYLQDLFHLSFYRNTVSTITMYSKLFVSYFITEVTICTCSGTINSFQWSLVNWASTGGCKVSRAAPNRTGQYGTRYSPPLSASLHHQLIVPPLPSGPGHPGQLSLGKDTVYFRHRTAPAAVGGWLPPPPPPFSWCVTAKCKQRCASGFWRSSSWLRLSRSRPKRDGSGSETQDWGKSQPYYNSQLKITLIKE